MELGELVTVALPNQQPEAECPFSHERPNPDEKNELGGIGSTLGTNMAAGRGVNTSKPPIGPDFTSGDKEGDPRDPPTKLTSISIQVNGVPVALQGKTLAYPLTCAAHHLIPAQESLKGSPILKFMCKDGESQDFRSSSKAAPAAVPDAAVWGNVAYNVNGSQNGVWLPGNYAVGAGIGGVEVWKNRASDKRETYTDQQAAENWERAVDLDPAEWAPISIDPQEQEGPQPGTSLASALLHASQSEYMLSGKNHSIEAGNPKWGYVRAAMNAASGQFHDRHETYSGGVKSYLKKIAAVYEQMYDRSVATENPCAKCKEARVPAGAKASLVGPPYGIVARLVVASNFFKKYVATETLTARNIFTSKWVKAWMDKKA